MARYQKQRIDYPMGTVSSGTMREEDLIPECLWTLKHLAKQSGILPLKTRRAHLALCREIESRMEADDYYESEDASYDLNEDLFPALDEYAAPYFYFGSHPGDGAAYGFWLSEMFEEDFEGLKVSDLSEIPPKYRGEVLVINDHGNMSLYVKTCRTLREVWAVV